MVQIRAQDVDRFLKRPDPGKRVILIYGADTGLVSERAAELAGTVLRDSSDPFALIRLDSAEIAADPGRLADEANTIALFGGTRAIRVRVAGNRPIQASVEAVLAKPPTDSWVILEAGDIKKGTGLRKLCEAAPGAAAIACYADDNAAIDRLIEAELASAGLSIEPDAKAELRELLGSDRLASRAELAKLALYAHGAATVDRAAVRAIVGDASALDADEAVDALAIGDTAALGGIFRRLIDSGATAYSVAGAALRHLQMLHRLRLLIEDGRSLEAVQDAAGFLSFRRKALLGQQLAAWTPDRLAQALQRIDGAILDSRRHAAIGDEILGQALLAAASLARPGRRSAG